MIKVVIILERFSIGGAQRVVSELVQNLNRDSIDLLVVCLQDRKETAIATDVERIARVKYLGIKGKNLIKNYLKVSAVLKDFQPNVIHAHLVGQLYAVPWGIIHGIPVIITAHTKPEKAFVKKIEPLIRYGIEKDQIYIVAVSEENLVLIKNYFLLNDTQCVCINNGINVSTFYKTRHELFTFINVARQDENKNQIAILKCFEKLYKERHDIKLILVGDGPCHRMLEEEKKHLLINDAVELPGAVGNVKDYYAVSDVYIQSSHREAMPMSVLEALAVGLPIISTNVGGLMDVVKENGILIPDNNEDELFKAMKKMLNIQSDLRDKMGSISKTIATRYSSKTMAESYEELYRKVGHKVNEN